MTNNKQKLLILVLTIGTLLGCGKTVTVRATVIEHNVTSDSRGDRTYSTILKTDDGYIEEEVGLKYYVMPIGSRTNLRTFRINNEQQ
jgi:hypothetical protein